MSKYKYIHVYPKVVEYIKNYILEYAYRKITDLIVPRYLEGPLSI